MIARMERRLEGARGPEGRIVLLISVLLGFEAVLYSAVTPILPHYANEFSASKPAIGLLAAAYPAGMIPGSLLGGWIATRAEFAARRSSASLCSPSRSSRSGSQRAWRCSTSCGSCRAPRAA